MIFAAFLCSSSLYTEFIWKNKQSEDVILGIDINGHFFYWYNNI